MTSFHELLGENFVPYQAHDPELQRMYWNQAWGYTCPWHPITHVLVHRPGEEIRRFDSAVYDERLGGLVLRDEMGRILSYCTSTRPPDLSLLQTQHDAMTTVLRRAGIQVSELCHPLPNHPVRGLNHLFTRDLGLVIPGGVVMSRFALWMRYGETRLAQEALTRLGVPIAGLIQGTGVLEGGSFTMLDPCTALVGQSIRVNEDGIRQLKHILSWQGIELIVVDLPSTRIHLDEALLILDENLALVDPSVLPHWFLQTLSARGFRLVYTHPEDPPLSSNGLTLAPRSVLMPASANRTIDRLTKEGIDVISVDVSEINKMGGGIHCATLELAREENGCDTLHIV